MDEGAPDPERRALRRLTTILASDFVGFSRNMSRDEEDTARVLKAHRAVIDSIIDLHGGRIFNTAGDSVLAEFDSPVEAVRAATEVQEALAVRNAALPENRRLHLRIGVNLGDVMVRGTDLLGDAVNIAARLEGLAKPGGLTISRSVHDQIRGKLDLGFDELGPTELKNIGRPIEVLQLVGSGGSRPLQRPPEPRRAVARVALVVMLAAVLVVAAGFVYLGDPFRLFRSPTAPTDSGVAVPAAGAHWLNGRWLAIVYRQPPTEKQFCSEPGPRCRLMLVQGVTGDGTVGGRFGFPDNPAPATITVKGAALTIETGAPSLILVNRSEGGVLEGTIKDPAGNMSFIRIRKAE